MSFHADLPVNGTKTDANLLRENFNALKGFIDAVPAGPPGRDGRDGVDGAPGRDGADSTVPGPQGEPGPAFDGTLNAMLTVNTPASHDGVVINAPSGEDGSLRINAGAALLQIAAHPDGSVDFRLTSSPINFLHVDAAGNISFPALPTTDPQVPGALWNNAGVLSLSNG